jgi:hypothetical protein
VVLVTCTLATISLGAATAFAQAQAKEQVDSEDNVLGALRSGWSVTFVDGPVNSYVEKDGLKYAVVAAGEADEETEAAAEAFSDALRAGSAELVMNDDALGEVKGLDDDKILAKSETIPVDRIAIVRVFPAGEGKPDAVVVTVRDKAGEAVWALSGTAGEAVEAKQGTSGGMGVSRKASEAVGEVTESQTKSNEDAREEYAKRFLWPHTISSYRIGDEVVSSWRYVLKGKYQKQIGPEEFYREVGRVDLAEEYAHNDSMGTVGGTMIGVGIAGFIGFGAWAMTAGVLDGSGQESNWELPLGLTGASIGLWIGGAIVSPDQLHPVGAAEARELVDKYNQKLKKELGLSNEYSPMPRVSKQSIEYNWGIAPTDGGATGVLRIKF